MPCTHRFENQLIPHWEIEHLFIGTFNPSWNLNNAVQADYFYGRVRNNFWCILPRVFGGNDLKYCDLYSKLEYIQHHKIGITDLISKVINAEITNETDIIQLTTGFSDNVLNNYQLEFNIENIKDLIMRNINTIKGVYLTRSTLGGINQITNGWNEIEIFCNQHQIHTEKLRTPANYGGGCIVKSNDWSVKILR
jgi:hypothetical protein